MRILHRLEPFATVAPMIRPGATILTMSPPARREPIARRGWLRASAVELSRRLTQRHDRRTALQRAGMIGAGTALGLVGLAAVADPALAKTCKKKRDCPKGKKCKDKKNGKGRCK